MGFICRQVYVFCLAIFSGALVGLIFDVFRVKRKLIYTSDILVYIEDILYWIIISIVLFTLMYYSKESELRSYILLGLFIGTVMYMCILSKHVLFILEWILKILYRCIISPISILVKTVKILLRCVKFMSKRK